MLLALPSQSADQESVHVLFSFNPRAVIAAQARLAEAVNPYGPVAPSVDTLAILVKYEVSMASVLALNAVLARVGVGGGDYKTRASALTGSAEANAFYDFANWLALGAQITPGQNYLFNDPIIKESLGDLAKADRSVKGEGEDDGWLTPDERASLALVTLWCSYGRITSSFLTAEEQTPNGSSKDVFPIVVRIQKAVATVVALSHLTGLSALREMAAFLQSELVKPLFSYVNPTVRDEVLHYAGRVSGMKTHPWLAEAERLRVPARRPTLRGRANLSMGLSSSQQGHGLWHLMANYANARLEGFADLRDAFLDPTENGMLMAFHRKSRDLFMLRDVLDQGYLASAEGMFASATASNPPFVHLHGASWKPLIMSGGMASESITDVMQLLTRPRFPRLSAAGDPGQLAGNAAVYDYDASKWGEESDTSDYALTLLRRPVHVPPLYVTPHRPLLTKGVGLSMLVPEMFRPVVDTEYFGDDDAVFVPYDPDALAKALSYADADRMRKMPDSEARLAHLFKFDAGQRRWTKTVPGAERIFRSGRTTQPWRTAVHLPVAIPPMTMALDHRMAPIEDPVQAVVGRSPELPTLVSDTLPAADALARQALAGLGFTASP